MKFQLENISTPQLLDFSKVGSSSLGFITIAQELPFEIKRVYWTYYAPHEVKRGNHAHKELTQVIFAVSGTIKFEIENTSGHKSNFILDTPELGLYIPKLHWRTMQFSHNAVLLCLASDHYDESDYIREYNDFISFRKK